jgi:hypothetical protein
MKHAINSGRTSFSSVESIPGKKSDEKKIPLLEKSDKLKDNLPKK